MKLFLEYIHNTFKEKSFPTLDKYTYKMMYHFIPFYKYVQSRNLIIA